MLLALILAAAATLLLCWLLYSLAALALPLFVGALAAHWAYGGDAGLVGSLLVGVVAGGGTLFAGQLLLASSRSTGVRTGIALLFVAPAALAGYSAAHGVAAIGLVSPVWQFLLGLAGGVAVGMSALARLAAATPNASERDHGTMAPELTVQP